MGNDGYLCRYPCHVVFLLKGRIVFSLLFCVASLVPDHFVNTVTLNVLLFCRFPIARLVPVRPFSFLLPAELHYSHGMPTVTEADGTTRTKKYEELSATEKIQVDCDCKATNIVLQGLPPDVYAIVNHPKVAKEIWDRVKLMMQGTKLSLQEKECKLYDEFDKFTFVKGETLYHLLPEWSKYGMDVKLARDLRTTNYDQLYSYLEQHEVHANEIRLMRECYQDPLAFVANYNQPPSQLTNYHSQYNPTHVPQQTNNMIPQVYFPHSFSLIYPSTHPSQPKINHSSIPPSHPYQSQMIMLE
ncbi:hypothetical protein Tco_1494252 [Tanacetum coccineum]